MSSNPLIDPLDRRVPLIPAPCALNIFGATGDLARRKILPAIYDLTNRGLLPAGFSLTGVGRSALTREEFIRQTHGAVATAARTPFRQRVWEQLATAMDYVAGDVGEAATYQKLEARLAASDRELGTGGNRVFYLSMPPATFGLICGQLAATGLAGPGQKVVIEKPFGHDLASARELDATLAGAFEPSSVFRIDHYLGKETVRGMLATRFANRVFEPLWSCEHVDHVQITMAEELGVGSRAGYYDGIGAVRDVMQNHLFQLLALTAMEPPETFGSADLRDAKLAALQAVRLPEPVENCAARGMYGPGWQGNLPVRGYLEEDGIPPESVTDTYGALKLRVATDRWRDTPFYLRTGKRLGRRVTEVALVFKPTTPLAGMGVSPATPNALVIRIQPDQGITLRVGAKVPETAMDVRDVTMDFSYGHAFTEALPDAYERLILDVLLGLDPLFPRSAEVEESWRVIDQVEQHWAATGTAPELYPAGTWGPAGAQALLQRDGREWRRP
ncbi:MAG: glucose-6-phosphate dehydrogenase [Bifidobacteriaceae bacterium]|jgi:glucose-6-phosphate 1-dehydrogenase|nr:glucose-6-phosphate dehydrogenase [Bifidobacteriaceae bacterium]